MRDIHVYNGYHLGDSIFLIHYLRKVCEQNSDIRAFCYIRKGHLNEASKHLSGFEDRIISQRLVEIKDGFVNGWAGSLPNERRVGLRRHRAWCLNEVYFKLYEYMSERLNIKNPFTGKDCTIMDNPRLLDPVHNDFKDCDFLFVNCPALSGQYGYKPSSFVSKIDEFRDKCDCTFACVHPLRDDIPSTLDCNLDLIQIGAIARQAKYIVGVASSPIIYCFNKWNIDTVKKWVVLSNRSTYTYNDRIIRKGDVRSLIIEELLV